jgi:hypothetical protein
MVTNFHYGRTWFGSHKFAREPSFIQSVLSCCHAKSRMHCAPVFLSAGIYPSEVEVNVISPPSAVLMNACLYTSNAQQSNALFTSL